jgi:hypothetical protein
MQNRRLRWGFVYEYTFRGEPGSILLLIGAFIFDKIPPPRSKRWRIRQAKLRNHVREAVTEIAENHVADTPKMGIAIDFERSRRKVSCGSIGYEGESAS